MKYYVDPCCRKRLCPKLLVEDGEVTIIDHYDRFTVVPEVEFKAMAVAEMNSLPHHTDFVLGPVSMTRNQWRTLAEAYINQSDIYPAT